MSSFDDGLEYLIRQLQRSERLGQERFPRALLTRIEAVAAMGVEPPVEVPKKIPPAPDALDALDPWQTAALGASVTLASPEVATPVLEALREVVRACRKCPHLAASRRQVVFGTGNPEADLMFVGEAPGADEDLRGEPFVGRAGELLTRIIEAMGFSREEVYIANVLKCRPDMPPDTPGNRPPTPAEMEACLPYLRDQIRAIRPQVMVALGGVAMRGLFGVMAPMRDLRGRWHEFGAIPVMATFHPSYLLRNQALSEKRKVWEDMLSVLGRLNRPVTDKQRAYFLAK